MIEEAEKITTFYQQFFISIENSFWLEKAKSHSQKPAELFSFRMFKH